MQDYKKIMFFESDYYDCNYQNIIFLRQQIHSKN